MSPKPSLLAVGAAHIDRRGRLSGVHVPGASNPGAMREEVGGGAFNALRNAMRHGVGGAMMSLRGGDVAGDAVARAIAAAGARDLSAIYLDRATPSYTAILDMDGELITGFADMALYEAGFLRHIRRTGPREALTACDVVLCDANMPADAVRWLSSHCGDRPVHAIAISPAKAPRLIPSLGRLDTVFMNAREARALAGLGEDAALGEAVAGLAAAGLKRGVITAGAAALAGFDADGTFTIAPPPAADIADVTGAGDAVAGAAVAAMMCGTSFREAVRHGMAAAMLTVESPAVVADYGDAAFAAALALVGEPRPMA